MNVCLLATLGLDSDVSGLASVDSSFLFQGLGKKASWDPDSTCFMVSDCGKRLCAHDICVCTCVYVYLEMYFQRSAPHKYLLFELLCICIWSVETP